MKNILKHLSKIPQINGETVSQIYKSLEEEKVSKIRIEAYLNFAKKLKSKEDLYRGWIISPIITFKDLDDVLTELINEEL